MGKQGKLETRCGKCGVQITSHGKRTSLCRACFLVQPKNCRTCGKPMPKYSRAVQCRDCWSVRGKQPARLCTNCGKALSRGASPERTLCKACSSPAPRFCVDCGKLLAPNSKATHCWGCYTTRRQGIAATKSCMIPGCTNPHAAKGLCALHYERKRTTTTRNGRKIDTVTRIWVAMQPCQLCGYSRMRSHVHRPTKQGDYVVGNMVALCARCHDEVHSGLAPCPQPLTP